METEFERKKKAEKFAGKFHMKEFYSRACVCVCNMRCTHVCMRLRMEGISDGR